MNIAAVLTPLYAVSGLAGAACYLPQLRLMWRHADARRAQSPAAWGGWSAIGAIGLLYALFVVGDPLLAGIGGLNLLCQMAVLGLALAARLPLGEGGAPRCGSGATSPPKIQSRSRQVVIS